MVPGVYSLINIYSGRLCPIYVILEIGKGVHNNVLRTMNFFAVTEFQKSFTYFPKSLFILSWCFDCSSCGDFHF